MLSANLLTSRAYAAGEVEVSSSIWSIGETTLICKLYHDEDSVMDGTLRCYKDVSNNGTQVLGEKVFEFREEIGPISVGPAAGPSSDALLTMWASGAYACYIAFGYAKPSITQLFRQCTKGGIEVLADAKGGVLFLVTDYKITSKRGWFPSVTTLYFWVGGILKTYKSPWVSRLSTAQRLINPHDRVLKLDALKPAP